MSEHIIIRYTPPTKFDDGLYGQICRAEGDGNHAYFIQVSKKEGENKWLPMGEFLERVFKEKFYDTQWVNDCLENL